MLRSLLIRGMLVGLVAGLLAFVFAYVLGEPQVQHAIDFENLRIDRALRAGGPNTGQTPDPVGRGTQRTVGLLTGTVVLGVGLGGLFALTFAWAYGRVAAVGPRALAATLAAGAYLTITVVPFTKYPANPPSIGNPGTIGRRTVLFVAMIAISVLAAVAAGRVRRTVRPGLGGFDAGLVGVAAFIVIVALAELILPTVHETPPGFPADVLWRFRLASLGTNATIWATIGLGFGVLAKRLIASRPSHAIGLGAR